MQAVAVVALGTHLLLEGLCVFAGSQLGAEADLLSVPGPRDLRWSVAGYLRACLRVGGGPGLSVSSFTTTALADRHIDELAEDRLLDAADLADAMAGCAADR